MTKNKTKNSDEKLADNDIIGIIKTKEKTNALELEKELYV